MKRLLLIPILATLSFNGMAQEADALLASAYRHSAFALFNAVAQQETGNICFSPLSVQMALSMVQNGAAGNTLSQLQKALGTEGFSNEEIGLFNSKLSKALSDRPIDLMEEIEQDAEWQGVDPQELYDGYYPKCELANALWTRPNVKLYDDFVETLRSYYDAGVDAVWFDTWEGIEKLNTWACDKTHGLIPQIYEQPQPSDLALVLMNALYFKGAWSVPFESEETSKEPFWMSDDTYAKVDMMFNRDKYKCAITPSFQTITLYYGLNGDFSMTLFVPLEGTALPPLSLDEWKASQNTELLHINLYLPRFEIAGNYNLADVMKGLGVTDAFSDAADFTKMCEVNRAIGSIFQLSKIIVNESGTEAAAVTVIEMPDGMDMTKPEDYQDFKVDRPFYFTIQSRNVILFAGRVTHLEGPVEKVDAVRNLYKPTPDPSRKGRGQAGAVYDLIGRRVAANSLPRGIFIKDGRKVVVK